MATDPEAAVRELADGTGFYGRRGVVRYDPDEDKVQCHLCGEWLYQVGGSHLLRKHGWTIEQYRREFRIPKRIATCGRGLSQTRRAKTLERIASGGDLAPPGRFGTERASARAGGKAAAGKRISGGARKPVLEHRPVLAADWHPSRNDGVIAEELGVTSPVVVWWCCHDCGHEWAASVRSRAMSGTGCPRCAREHARRQAGLLNERRAHALSSSRGLAVTNPVLAAELHPTRNAGITPELLLAGSGKSVWWLCSVCGHEWQAQVNNRSNGTGCPACAKQTPADPRSAAKRRRSRPRRLAQIESRPWMAENAEHHASSAEPLRDELMKVDEVAALLRVNPQTVRNRIDAGDVPVIRFGRRVRIRRSALEQIIGASDAGVGALPWQSPSVNGQSFDAEAVASVIDDIAYDFARLAAVVRGEQPPVRKRRNTKK